MGQGRIGCDLGADLSIGWTYKRRENIELLPGRIIEEGNLLDKKERAGMFNALDVHIDKENYQLGAIFFRAVGGFNQYIKNTYALASLYDLVLRPLYERAPVGADFFLNIDFAGTHHPTNVMSDLSRRGYNIRGPRNRCFVLEKSQEHLILPSLRKMSRDVD